MPISAYYKGHGEKVMADMEKRYGEKQGERVFYATANKRKMKPGQGGPSAKTQAAALDE